MMKDDLCEAFCNELRIREVPAGLAISTGFDGVSGDPIGFYVVGPDAQGRYRIQDDGLTLMNLETVGADLEIPSRAEAFHSLLKEYGFIYDRDEHILGSKALASTDVAGNALRFVALLLRVQDIVLMVQERAANTFKEEALRGIRELIGKRAEVLENEILHPKLADYPADVVFRSPKRNPVALFFGTSDQHLLEAIVLDLAARYEAKIPCEIVVLLEKENSVTQKHRQQASNRLAAVASYKGDELAALKRIERAVVGETLH